MYVAKVLASFALVVIGIAVVKPLIAIVGMSVMCLVKGLLINRLRYALHSHEEHSDGHQFENYVTHLNSLHKMRQNVQVQFTHPGFSRSIFKKLLSICFYC